MRLRFLNPFTVAVVATVQAEYGPFSFKEIDNEKDRHHRHYRHHEVSKGFSSLNKGHHYFRQMPPWENAPNMDAPSDLERAERKGIIPSLQEVKRWIFLYYVLEHLWKQLST
jgi:hypothetical protein